MPRLAFTVIGHNDSALLGQALESIAWADEIIYVDCESQDNSLEIAQRYTTQVFSRPNDANLNRNKAYAIAQVSAEWVFYLDPDERIPEALGRALREVIEHPGRHQAFRLPRRNYYFGRFLRYGGQYPDLQLRLFRRGKAFFPCLDVHETLVVEGSVGQLAEAMEHLTCPTVYDALRKMDFYSTFHARKMLESGQRASLGMALGYGFFKPTGKFVRRYIFKGGFLDGWPGFIQALISAMDFVFRLAKLWQEQLTASKRSP